MDVKYKKMPFFEDLYSQHLSVINNVKLTRREIDIIAFFVCGRSPKKIASFFSISPKTVENHTHNIRLKLGCSSKDNIIDFIEKSKMLHILRKHYMNIIINSEFHTCLSEIAKKVKDPPVFHVTRPKLENNITHRFIEFLKDSFRILNIKIVMSEDTLNIDDFQKDNYVLCLSSKEEIISLLFFSPEANEPKVIKWENDKKDIYLTFFEILHYLLPNLRQEQIIKKFIDQCKEIDTTQVESTFNEENYQLSVFSRVNYSIIVFIFCITVAIGFYTYYLKPSKNQLIHLEDQQSIRSDLSVPTESARLDRPDLIEQINDRFQGWSGIQSVALVGIGGSGKTTLARQYASLQKLPHLWEINAETKETLNESFENLAHTLVKTDEDKRILKGILGIKLNSEKEEKLVQFVKEKLRNVPAWFFIYDNVDKFADVQNFFPKDSTKWGQGRIILTTRNRNIESNKHVNNIIYINELKPEEKLTLFLKIMNNGKKESLSPYNKEDITKFLSEIPSFPLDVSVAAYYLKATHIPFNKYLDNMAKFGKEIAYIQKNILQEAGDYIKTRHSIITLTLKDLLEENTEFKDILLFISLIDPVHIPRDLLSTYKNDIIIDKFLYNLNKYSLINMNSLLNQESIISIHRSIQAIVRDHLLKNLKLGEEKPLVSSIAKALQVSMREALDKEDFAKMKILSKHAEHLLKHNNLLLNEDSDRLRCELGSICYYLCMYSKAREFLEDGLKHFKKQPQKFVSEIARYSLYLGNTYRRLGDLNKAKELYEVCLSLYERNADRPLAMARASGSLGLIYEHQGDFNKAKELLEKSLVIYKQSSEKSIGFAWSLAHLGQLYDALGEYNKAKDLLEQSLSIYKAYSDNYVGAAWVYGILGKIYLKLGDNKRAKAFIDESLKIYNKHFLENHYYIAKASINLANYYIAEGNYEKGKALLKKSLVDIEDCYGVGHIETSNALKNLGRIYLLEGNLDIAENIFNKTLSIYKKSDNPNKFEILEELSNLKLKEAKLRIEKLNFPEAKRLIAESIGYLKEAQTIAIDHFPENSPNINRINSKIIEAQMMEKNRGNLLKYSTQIK